MTLQQYGSCFATLERGALPSPPPHPPARGGSLRDPFSSVRTALKKGTTSLRSVVKKAWMIEVVASLYNILEFSGSPQDRKCPYFRKLLNLKSLELLPSWNSWIRAPTQTCHFMFVCQQCSSQTVTTFSYFQRQHPGCQVGIGETPIFGHFVLLWNLFNFQMPTALSKTKVGIIKWLYTLWIWPEKYFYAQKSQNFLSFIY